MFKGQAEEREESAAGWGACVPPVSEGLIRDPGSPPGSGQAEAEAAPPPPSASSADLLSASTPLLPYLSLRFAPLFRPTNLLSVQHMDVQHTHKHTRKGAMR